jgi:uncharacterized Ntn-hydrolase superfamily protein
MKPTPFVFLLAALSVVALPAPAFTQETGIVDGTFSIIGRDPQTGDLGIAVASRTIAVGARVRGGKAGVAVFAHQSGSNPMYSELGVELLLAGFTPDSALAFLLRGDNGGMNRQVSILDAQGRTAAWTSPTISDWKGHKCGMNYCAQGNTLTGPEVVDAMAASFESSTGSLAWKLLNALAAGDAAGGDRRGRQSASLLILRPLGQNYSDRWLDLRVDEHTTPIPELSRILCLTQQGRAGCPTQSAPPPG